MDASPCRREVFLHGQAHGTAVGQPHGALDQALSKAATPHHQTTVPILHGARHDFTGAGRRFVDEHHEAPLFEQPLVLGEGVFALESPSFCVHDELVAAQELVGHCDGRAEHAAAVALQVEDEVFHALVLQVQQRLPELVHGRLGKSADLDVPHLAVHHVGGVDAVNRNLVPDDVEGDEVRLSIAFHAHLHDGALGALQQLHDVFVGDANAGDVFAVDFHKPIARPNAEAFRRAAADGRHHHDRVLEDVELHPDAFEVAVEGLVRLLELLRREIHRVRVEVLEHFHDGLFRERLHVHTVDVQLTDVTHEGPKLLGRLLRGHVVGRVGLGLQRDG